MSETLFIIVECALVAFLAWFLFIGIWYAFTGTWYGFKDGRDGQFEDTPFPQVGRPVLTVMELRSQLAGPSLSRHDAAVTVRDQDGRELQIVGTQTLEECGAMYEFVIRVLDE